MRLRWKDSLPCLFATVLATVACITQLPGQAKIIQQDDNDLSNELQIPVSVWSDTAAKPRAVIVAVHGLTMHGGTFDVMARSLAAQGFLVVAQDLRGYGHWLAGKKSVPADASINYEKSQLDLQNLLVKVNERYPKLPHLCVGESLGADECILATAARPDLVDGIVLASPALKRRTFITKTVLKDLTRLCTAPNCQLNLVPYIKLCASEDPKIIQGMLDDPLVRKHLSSRELIKSQHFMTKTRKEIAKLPDKTPVLIIQGDGDRLLKSNAVVTLLGKLKSKDQTVRWFPERGHVLLETSFVQPDTLKVVQDWLMQHAGISSAVQSAQASDEVAVESE